MTNDETSFMNRLMSMNSELSQMQHFFKGKHHVLNSISNAQQAIAVLAKEVIISAEYEEEERLIKEKEENNAKKS